MGRNLEHNKKIFAEYEKQLVGKAICSKDGFIEYQNGMHEVKYGCVTAAYGGCGAIAVWNILKFWEKKIAKEILFDEMEKGTILGGKLGTEIFFVKNYLERKGLRANMYYSLKEFKSSGAEAGILYYIKGDMRAHYVAFTPSGVNWKGEHLYRFHNAKAGSHWISYNHLKYIENLPMTIDDFLSESKAKIKVFYDVRK